MFTLDQVVPSDHLTEAFHRAATLELCRVASEVRLFPLLDLSGRTSRHAQSVAEMMEDRGHHVSIDVVPYEFQRGGNQMMRVRCNNNG